MSFENQRPCRRRHGVHPIIRLCATLTLLLVVTTHPVLVQVPSTLARQPRDSGRYREGLILEPKNDNALTLVSAIAMTTATNILDDWPKVLSLHFFIPPDQQKAHVTLRQFRSRNGYYMLDEVASSLTNWKPGALNDFSWPADVMAGVYNYQLSRAGDSVGSKAEWLGDIGMVVRLDADGPIISGGSSIVAPAILRSSTQSAEVVGYRFGFTTNASTAVQASITADAGGAPLLKQSPAAVGGGLTTIIWTVNGQADGWYRLLLTADFPGQPQMVVRFYHRRTLGPS
jgi:hypothetical protein